MQSFYPISYQCIINGEQANVAKARGDFGRGVNLKTIPNIKNEYFHYMILTLSHIKIIIY